MDANQEEQRRGQRGEWLRRLPRLIDSACLNLFCVWTVILGPARAVFEAIGINDTAQRIILIGYAALQLFVGVSVWLRSPRALAYLRLFLIVLLLLGITNSSIGIYARHRNGLQLGSDAESLLSTGVVDLIACFFWWSFFRHSEEAGRVLGRNL